MGVLVATNNTNEKVFFNLDELLNRTDGDKELACELMHMYLEQVVQNMSDIEDAIAKKDAKRLQFVAHSLKGSSADLSAETVRSIAYQMERCGASGEISSASAILVQLKESLNNTTRLISKRLEECKSSSRGT
jgi:HPt (histidine-containing phosphotransfer) domain-containing protein